MKIEGINGKQWGLYDYLKKNAVGKLNAKSTDVIITALDYPNIRELRKDIKALREAPLRRIDSCDKGYYLPRSAEECSNTNRSKIYSFILTGLKNGDISKNEIYSLLNNYDPDMSIDNQMKIMFTPNEEDARHRYSNDLFIEQQIEREIDQMSPKEQFDYYREKYLKLGGYPIKLTLEEYKEEVKKLEASQSKS